MGLGPKEIENRFGFHKATLEGVNATAPLHREMRVEFKEFATELDALFDACQANPRYGELAMTALEEAAMWSHKAVAATAPLEED